MDEIFSLIKQAQEGDEAAKTRLIEENSPLIKSIIRHYKNKGVEYDDLYQIGCMGFLKAVKNFSFDYGVRFSTYAVPMIAGEVKRFLRDDGYIKVSRSTKSLAGKINKYVEEYKHENMSSPPIDMIAKAFGMDTYDVVFAMDSLRSPLSLYEKGDDENAQSILDRVADKDTVEDKINRIILKDFIAGLNERDRTIIMLRYFKDKTQSEIAKVLNVSQVQVSRLETKILNRIKQIYSED